TVGLRLFPRYPTMLSRFMRAALCLGGAVAAACSDSPTAATPDTTTTPVNTTTSTCSGALSMSAGQVVAGVSGSSICVSGGVAGAEYALIPFYGTTVASASTSLDFTATGTASPSAAPSLIPSASASLDLSGSSAGLPTRYRASHDFEPTLRDRDRVQLH